MKLLAKKDKKIIKLIQKGIITDIYSYVQYFELGEYVKYDEAKIQEDFEKKYGNTKIVIKKEVNSIIEKKHIIGKVKEDQYWGKPYLDYSEGPELNLICYNEELKYNYNLTKPIYLSENIDEILNFISIWQFLEEEHLIINLPKSCEERDMGLFLKKVDHEFSGRQFPDHISNTYELKVDAGEFMDWKLELNIHNFEICLPYLKKQIQPTLSLNDFVKKRFRTKRDLIEQRNFLIALIGVIVAIIAAGTSLVASFFNKSNSGDLNQINSTLQEIKQEIENIDEQFSK